MRKFIHAFTLVALFAFPPGPSPGQEVNLPPEVKGPVNTPIQIIPLNIDGGTPKWKIGKGLTLMDLSKLLVIEWPDEVPQLDKDGKPVPGPAKATIKTRGVVVYGPNGTYEVWAWNAKGSKASNLAVTKVVVGTGIPDLPIPQPPGPTPPGPLPPPVPPPSPALIDLPGLAMLIVEESKDRRDSMPPALRNYLFSTEDFWKTLNEKCVKEPNGKTAWRIWDKDDVVTGAPPYWQKAFNTAPKDVAQLPWMIVSNPRKGGWAGSIRSFSPEQVKAKVLQFAD